MTTNSFPGGTAVSQLTVYDWSSPDGLRGGSAHVHLTCTEGYVVTGGHGRLQTLGPDGFQETPLSPLTVAWFSPGIIHRLVNDEDLQIVVVMQNGGLPEAGDCVLTFPPEHLADAETYRRRASLTGTGEVYASDAEAAERRKNLAVDGFLALRRRLDEEGPGALDDFYTAATRITSDQRAAWRSTWEQGALAAARRTGEQLDALDREEIKHLHDGRLSVLPAPEDRKYGMCGRLATYDLRNG